MRVRRPRPWIPPEGLIAGHLAYGASWLLLASAAFQGSLGFGLELAWIHVVALGWITTIALAVLIHVIPGFTDAAWRHEGLARAAIPVFATGAALLALGFALDARALLPIGGSILSAALAGFLFAALSTLARAAPERQERAIAAALGLTLAVLGVTAALGYAFTFALGPGLFIDLLRLAPAHAVLGIVGWLTILTTGVSTRTFRPIFRSKTRAVLAHVGIGFALTGGSVAAALAIALESGFWLDVSLLAIGAGALAYVADAFDIALRATNPHRPPQAFVVAALFWLLAAVALAGAGRFGAATLPVAIFIALAGWAGQMVNAHLHHLGIRLIATLILGEDDETRPQHLLEPRLSWLAFASAQIAVLLGALGVALLRTELLGFAGLAGCIAFSALSGNVLFARSAALRRRAVGVAAGL
jgi:hypothetical protein